MIGHGRAQTESNLTTFTIFGAEVLADFRRLFGLANVSVAEPLAVRRALDYAEQGLDFADALHLAQASECEACVTFDKRLARKAEKLADARVRLG